MENGLQEEHFPLSGDIAVESPDLPRLASRIPAAGDGAATRSLAVLAAASFIGLAAVWMLRQDWAKPRLWTWLPLLLAMFAAGYALQRLDAWLPGQPILPRLAEFPHGRRRLAGLAAMVAAALLTGWLVSRLWPETRQWHGAPLIWAAALALVLIGSGVLGAVGRASARAAAALSWWPDARRARWLEAAAFALILLLAIFLRIYRLNAIPPGIYVDETNGALDALRILEGNGASPFGTGWYGTPNGYLYYMAAVFKLLGAGWYSLKLVSLLPAILTIPAVYLLGRLMYGPSAGLIAMFLMAVSRWHLSMSRWGWNETAPPLFQVLATFFLWRGLRDRRALDYALGGVLAGLSLYTYLSARLALATLFIYILFWLVSDPAGWRAGLRRSGAGLLVLALGAGVAAAPLAVTYAKDPFALSNRVSEISVTRDIREQGSLAPLAQNLGDIFKFFHQTGDLQGKHNLPGEPMADPFTGLFFAIGLAYAISGWREQRSFLLLLWLVLGLAGSFLSSHSESPQSYRALTALPAVVLLAADAIDRSGRGLHRWLGERSWIAPRPRLPALASAILIAAVAAGAALWESSVYFGRQAASIDVVRGFNPSENRVAREVLNALNQDMDVYLSPGFSTFSPVRFLVYGALKRQTGGNALEHPPFSLVIPEIDLPVPAHGRDVLVLLDAEYWPLRGYIASIYPQAQMQLVTLADETPVYFRIQIPEAQVSALQGLTQETTFPDGRVTQRMVQGVGLEPGDEKASQIIWEGAIRLDHGAEYELRGEGGLDVFLDDVPVQGPHYQGRGLYRLRVIWNGGDRPDARLRWRIGDGAVTEVPPEDLFRLTGAPRGLLATYWRNLNWENAPVFHQVTPFLLLEWPGEQPLLPNGPFTARFTGWLHIAQPGTYLFRIEADDGARLVLDEQVVGEGMTAGQPNKFETSVDLAAGDHSIRIDYLQQGGGSALRFFWKEGDGPYVPVPPDVLIPARP
ncbi:MAG TPA: PA14 domain-containing protein [Anaerolineales bacterium]